MKFCKTCGSILPDDSVFCTNCGVAIESETEGTVVLSDDGQEQTEGTAVLTDDADGETGTALLEEKEEFDPRFGAAENEKKAAADDVTAVRKEKHKNKKTEEDRVTQPNNGLQKANFVTGVLAIVSGIVTVFRYYLYWRGLPITLLATALCVILFVVSLKVKRLPKIVRILFLLLFIAATAVSVYLFFDLSWYYSFHWIF